MTDLQQTLPNFRWIAAWSIRVLAVILLVHVLVYFGPAPADFKLSFPAALIFVVLLGWLGTIDSRLRGEKMFLASLGVSPIVVGSIWSGIALLIEACIMLV